MAYDAGAVVGRIVLNTRGWDTAHGKVLGDLRTLGRVATAYGALATAAVYKLMRGYAEFENEMRKATSVMDISEATFQRMSTAAEEASIRYNIAATDTAKAYLYMGRAGLTAQQQMEAFPSIVAASKSMMEDMQLTTEGIINTMNAFNYSFSQTETVVNLVTAAVNKSTQDLSDMLTALSYSAKPAQSMNNSLADLSAMLATAANEGIRGSKAGTAIRYALTSMAAPMADANQMLRNLGVNAYDANGKALPLIDVIGKLQTRLDGVSDKAVNRVLGILFGKRALPTMTALFQTGAEGLRAYSTELENTGDTAETVADRMMKSFASQLGKMYRTLQMLTRHIAGALAPTIQQWANGLERKMQVWIKWVDTHREGVKHIALLVTKIGLLSLAFGALMIVLPGVVSTFQILAGAVEVTYSGMLKLFQLMINPSKLLGAVRSLSSSWIVALVGIYMLSVIWRSNFNGMRDITKQFYKDVGTYMTGLATDCVTIFNWIRDKWNDRWKDMFVRLFGWLMPLINFLITIGKLAGSVVEQLSRMIVAAATGNFTEVWRQFNMNAPEGMKQFTDGLEWIAATVDDVVPKIGQTVVDMATYTGNELKELGATTLSYVKKDLGTAVEWITDTLFNNTVGKLFGKVFGGGVAGGADAVVPSEPPDTGGGGGGGVKELPFVQRWTASVQKILDDMKGLQEGMDDAMKDVVDGWTDAFDTVMERGSSFADFIDDIFSSILNSFKHMIAQMAANSMFMAIFGKGYTSQSETLPLSLGTFIQSLFGGRGTIGGSVAPVGDFPTSGTAVGKMVGEATPKVAFVINNQTGGNVTAEQTGDIKFNGEEYVVNVVMKQLGSNATFRRALQGTGY